MNNTKRYAVKDGKVQTESVEVNVVHHCNLACRACSHLSPVLPKQLADHRQVTNDFAVLGRYYHATQVRVIGGEPLLHPELTQILKTIRASSICDQVRVATNGILLDRMTEQFWNLVDEVCISIYPGKEPSVEQLASWRRQAELHNVTLITYSFDHFRMSYSELGTSNQSLTQRIYQTCLVAHHWRCHTVENSTLYRCPQSLFIPQVLQLDGPLLDGLPLIDHPAFGDDLLRFLESSDPLRACRHCLGSVGALFPHEQIVRRHWRQPQLLPTEQLLDMAFLEALERAGEELDTLCIRPEPGALPASK